MKTIGLFRRVRAAVLGIAAAGVGASAWAVGQLESGEAMVPALYRTIVWANATADYPAGAFRRGEHRVHQRLVVSARRRGLIKCVS